MRAYELLKDRPYVDKVTSDGDLGRATSMAALGLRSRVLLYIASPLYNGNTDMASFRDVDGTPLISQTYDPEKWNEAAKAARLCLDEAAASGYVRLYERDSDPVTNYQNIFNQNWNEEILWAKNIGTYDHWENCCNPISFGCFSIINPTQEMVDAYEMADGSTPITGYTDNGLTPIINPESGYVEEGFTDTEYENRWQKGVSNMYVNREPRFYASINFAGAIWLTSRASNWTEPHTLEFWYTGVDGKNNAGSDYCKTGYLMKKLIYPTVIPFQSYPVQQWVYIRLGEIYLNYAEALNEYGSVQCGERDSQQSRPARSSDRTVAGADAGAHQTRASDRAGFRGSSFLRCPALEGCGAYREPARALHEHHGGNPYAGSCIL